MVKAKTKIRTCVHCGHTFDANAQRSDLSDPDWHPYASNYCSHECSDQFHCDLSHNCSTHVKQKARRDAAKAARRQA
ncbi:ferric uptake regulation protein [Mycobacterium sp. 1100029.7]|nr:ferric uptake regulation protein [Mycobacterium sp. 1100029.7]